MLISSSNAEHNPESNTEWSIIKVPSNQINSLRILFSVTFLEGDRRMSSASSYCILSGERTKRSKSPNLFDERLHLFCRLVLMRITNFPIHFTRSGPDLPPIMSLVLLRPRNICWTPWKHLNWNAQHHQKTTDLFFLFGHLIFIYILAQLFAISQRGTYSSVSQLAGWALRNEVWDPGESWPSNSC